MKVINLLAAPGYGKSASGQILSGLLSIAHYKVEYIPEFAKFATFADNQAALSDQIYMFSKQHNRLHVLKDASLDFVVMDGPLPIALLHTPEDYYKYYQPLVLEVFNSFENINFFIERNPNIPYKSHGRAQDEAQSAAMHSKLRAILQENEVPFTTVSLEPSLPWKLFKYVTGKEMLDIDLSSPLELS